MQTIPSWTPLDGIRLNLGEGEGEGGYCRLYLGGGGAIADYTLGRRGGGGGGGLLQTIPSWTPLDGIQLQIWPVLTVFLLASSSPLLHQNPKCVVWELLVP